MPPEEDARRVLFCVIHKLNAGNRKPCMAKNACAFTAQGSIILFSRPLKMDLLLLAVFWHRSFCRSVISSYYSFTASAGEIS